MKQVSSFQFLVAGSKNSARSAQPETRNQKPETKIKHLGLVDYLPTYEAMRDFTLTRNANTPDEIWVLQHAPVYTLGQAGKPEHLLTPTSIPVIKIDRGGQITYHGPGQIVIYLLLDLSRLNLKVRNLVFKIEQVIIDLLNGYNIAAFRQSGAPGVYVDGAKIAALGLRVRRGCCYHGLSFNVDMDLTPFNAINPCGYPGLKVTQMRDLGIADDMAQINEKLLKQLIKGIKDRE